MNEKRILQLFREVGVHYSYSSLAAVLDVTGPTVRGYLTGFIRPTQKRQYVKMLLVINAHDSGIAEDALDLRPSRGASLSEPRADQIHLLDCGRGNREKRTLASAFQSRRRAA